MDKKEMKDKEIQKKERDERAARRSLLKEAVKDEEEDASAPASKKPRLDLLDMLSSSTTSVLDILTASGRKPLPTFSKDQIIKETETESRPGVLDIFDALPKDALAEDKEPAVEVDINADLLSLAVVQTLTISPHSKVVMEEDSMKDSMEEKVSWFSEEENQKRSLQRWKMMGPEEKAFWRKRMEEKEKANKKI